MLGHEFGDYLRVGSAIDFEIRELEAIKILAVELDQVEIARDVVCQGW